MTGNRERAQAIVNNRINRMCSLGIDDLPDTADLWSIVDNIEAILEVAEVPRYSPIPSDTKKLIEEELSCLDMEFIKEMVYG